MTKGRFYVAFVMYSFESRNQNCLENLTLQNIFVQVSHRPRADPADVRREEHDGRLRPQTREVPHCRLCLQGPHVHEGG